MLESAGLIDTALDRSVVLGYGNLGYGIRSALSSWPPDPPRMDGATVLVTGARSGIGLAAAAGFAALGARVWVLGRDAGRAAEAESLTRRLVAEAAGDDRDDTDAATAADVRPAVCDVSSLAALREFTAWFAERETRLDVLVNNAGVMPPERRHTADGVELTFATHVLAPWVLTRDLTPLLRAAAPSRVVNISSGGQYGQRIPVDLESEASTYGPKTVYARTKRELVAITEMWAERLAADGVHVHAMHPGWVDTQGVRTWMPLFRMLIRPIIRTPEQGADTIVWLGAAPEAVESTGLFWHDRRPRPATYRFGAGPDDRRTRERLWEHVESLAERDLPGTEASRPARAD